MMVILKVDVQPLLLSMCVYREKIYNVLLSKMCIAVVEWHDAMLMYTCAVLCCAVL